MLTLRRGLAVVALAILAASLPGCASYGTSGYRVTAYFPRAVSLYTYSNVRVLGLPAGKVTAIEVVGNQVKVTMRIHRSINLPAGVRAALMPQSLIGERYVQLFPAWVQGQPKAGPGTVVSVEHTAIPTEPDETLATLKKFLDSLDPHATGAFIKNLSQDLSGNGQQLNDALNRLSRLSSTLADKDTQLGDLIDHFDAFASTLDTREVQLGKVMDAFATTTSLLVQERQDIEGLVHGLAVASASGLGIIGKHQVDLNSDLSALTRILETVNANVDNLQTLLKSGPLLVAGPSLDGKLGLNASYDPKNHHIDLRTSAGPLATALLNALGLPPLCVPIDTAPQCSPTVPVPAAEPQSGRTLPSTEAPTTTTPTTSVPGPPVTVPATIVPPITLPPITLPGVGPVDSMIGLLGSPTSNANAQMAAFVVPNTAPSASRDSGGVLGWIRRAARSIAEALT